MRLPPGTALDVSLRFSRHQTLPVGRLAWAKTHAVFEYDPAFIASGLRINPNLGVPTSALLEPKNPRVFRGLHGVFADSLPDAWGEALLRRRAEDEGVAYDTLNALDRLAWVGSNAMGALSYSPDYAQNPEDAPVDLDRYAAEAFALLQGEVDHVVPALIALGSPSGGARPKILVSLDDAGRASAIEKAGYSPWLIKFRGPQDPVDITRLEAAYADMARSAGITMSATRLVADGGAAYFATQRFDRSGPQRIHTLSFAAFLDADWYVPSGDYDLALRIVRNVVRDVGALEEMYRRMVFNVVAHNRDDHWKQHALLMSADGSWTLAPAFDLTPNYGSGGEHYLTINGRGKNITADDLLAVADAHAIRRPKAQAIIDDVRAAVADFDEHAARYDVSRSTVNATKALHAAAGASVNVGTARSKRLRRDPTK
jgi:serine/threonine-protein kinase HipA